ncbi:MAG: hypothetical protein RIT16_555 [Actinomycetota bacterium]|jgi:3-hydroxyisobutyrate dehydrogenase
MRCGFIGLGHIGKFLAGSLVRNGFEVTIYDLNADAGKPLVAKGAKWANSIKELCDASDTVFTCLPSPRAIDAVVAGPGGVLESLAGRATPGTWVDMSTNDQSETLRLGEIAKSKGVQILESPVTGGVHKAAHGDITVLVGGEDKVFQAHKAALAAMGNPVLYIGPLGSAAVIKVITNMLAFIHLVAAGEALMLAKRAGLDLGVAFEAIKESSGNSFVHETESQVILNGSYNINFTMDLALKDLGFAMGFGREFGVPLDLAGHTYQTFIRAKEAYGGDAWSSQVVKLLEDATGTDLRAPGFPAELE